MTKDAIVNIPSLIHSVLRAANTANSKFTISIYVYRWKNDIIKQLISDIITQSENYNVRVLGIRCDAHMLTTIGAERVDIMGGMIGSTPVSLNNGFYKLEVELSI